MYSRHQDQIQTSTHVAHGYAFLSLLLVITIISIGFAALQTSVALSERRQAEDELLFIGQQFQNALTSYATSSFAGTATSPNSIEDLLSDQRTGTVKHHLRKLYVDPITKSTEWDFLRDVRGGIVGVRSRSKLVPIKVENFSSNFRSFQGAQSYQDWIFSKV